MTDDPHVVEANAVERARFISAEPVKKSFIVVDGSAFPRDRDLPSEDDAVTIASGTRVLRGTVLGLAYVVGLEPSRGDA